MLWGISLSYVTEIERKLEKKKKNNTILSTALCSCTVINIWR